MSLSLGPRAQFFAGLGKLYEAGFPLLQALETLLQTTSSGSLHRVLQGLRASALQGANLTESLSAPGMPFDSMEISVLRACESSGKLPHGCQWLSGYFTRLDQTRRSIWKRAAYPLFLLHFGIILLALPKYFQNTATFSLFNDILQPLIVIYLFAGAAWILLRAVFGLARNSRVVDQILRRLPLVGGIRRSLAVMRFCTSYVMQLDAGVNVMDSLLSAAQASDSATLRAATAEAMPGVRLGKQVGPELAATGAFPPDLVRAMVLGEQTGTLDADLTRVAEDADRRAMSGIDLLGEWIPKFLYFGIVGFLAYNIVAAYKDSLGGLEKMME